MIPQLIDLVLHLDVHLRDLSNSLGGWVYLVLFLIIFCETGLVVTPILPGDSLLFAVGTVCSIEGSRLDIRLMIVLMCLAAILGDAVNYSIGLRLGPAVFKSETSRFLNKKYLERTQSFYERYGGKTIILARFIPIIRTFAPFVAGIGRMKYSRFVAFNAIGGVAWVSAFLVAGYEFGNIPSVKRNFHIVIIAIIILSVVPAVVEALRERARRPA